MENQKIYSALAAVMSEIGVIEKGKTNSQQGFKYRGVDDVMNALQPLLIKHKVFIVPEVLEQTREERTSTRGGTLIYSILKVKYTFYTDDGSYVSAIVIGEGMDSGDKASNKALSIAFKYACFQIFCIPTEEMQDPDSESHEIKPKQKTNSDIQYICTDCGKPFEPFEYKGKKYSAEAAYKAAIKKCSDGQARCKDCRIKAGYEA